MTIDYITFNDIDHAVFLDDKDALAKILFTLRDCIIELSYKTDLLHNEIYELKNQIKRLQNE